MSICDNCIYLDYYGENTYECLENGNIMSYEEMSNYDTCEYFTDYIRQDIEYLISKIQRIINKTHMKHYLEYDNNHISIDIFSYNFDENFLLKKINELIEKTQLNDFYIILNKEKIIQYY